jgi:hypothetical protein
VHRIFIRSVTVGSTLDKHWWHSTSARPKLNACTLQGLAELFSGLATYLNKVGHHRESKASDPDGELKAMPLEHWETGLAVGAAQFITAYALRLRASGILEQ